jgi:hypothetical protein
MWKPRAALLFYDDETTYPALPPNAESVDSRVTKRRIRDLLIGERSEQTNEERSTHLSEGQ